MLYWAFFFGASLFSLEQDRLFWHWNGETELGPVISDCQRQVMGSVADIKPFIHSSIQLSSIHPPTHLSIHPLPHPSIHPPIYLFIHPSLQPCMHAYVHPTNMILLRADFMQVLGEVLRMQFWANLRLLFPTTHSWTCCLVLYQSCVAVHRSSAGPRKELPFLTIFFLAKWSLLIWPTCYPVGLSLSPCLVSLCALHSSSSSWLVRI